MSASVTIDEAAVILARGGVVAVPTETVYGLAASIKHPAAIRQIFQLKGRPSDNPLIIHAADVADVEGCAASLPKGFDNLSKAFWPGPLTLVVPVAPGAVPAVVNAGLATAAFRVPSHPMTLDLIKKVGPLVMPSANFSGRPSPTMASHVEEDFKGAVPVLDGGRCSNGVESTILCWIGSQWVVGRFGALPPEAFASCLGYQPAVMDAPKKHGETPLCPGTKYKHYAPRAELHLVRSFAEEHAGGVVVGFSDRQYPSGCRLIPLGKSTDPEGALRNLYAVLRQLDKEGVSQAVVDCGFPDARLWSTLRERLVKASGVAT